MSNYTIAKLKPEEFHLLIPLMKDCFGMNVDVKYFEWKFLNNPAGYFEGFVSVAENGEIAAYYGAIPEVYIVNSKKTTIYQSCDTMTHSNHRRKGLFQKLALHCYDYLKSQNKLFVIGFGGGQSTPGFIKFGWVHTFNMQYYFYPKLFSYFHFRKSDSSIEQVDDYEKIENALLKSNVFADIHSHKSLEIFKWRISNPNIKYNVIANKSENKTYSSYLCYYTHKNKIVIFDMFFENILEGKMLMGKLKKILCTSDYKGIIAFCQEKSYTTNMLRKLNFVSNPFKKGPLSQKIPFIFYSLNEVMKENNDHNKWFISSFDHDSM